MVSRLGRVARAARRPRRLPRLLAVAALAVAAVLGARHALYALFPFPYRGAVVAAARSAHLDPLLLAAVIRTESGFHPEAASDKQALGLMQIVPSTGAWIAGRMGRHDFSPLALLQPDYNVQLGAWYLADLVSAFDGRLLPALAAYNAGREPVTRWLASGQWSGGYGDAARIPFPETRRFVQRVVAAYRVYRVLYGSGLAGG